ncbi:MAG TPA: hypothetical protein ENH84_03745 [Phycisphaerae bacterium]|nr:hypothetical protein [Phycisphaerae bacterium]
MRRPVRILLLPILMGALCVGLFLGRTISMAAEKTDSPVNPNAGVQRKSPSGTAVPAKAEMLPAVCIQNVPHIRRNPRVFTNADYAQHIMELKRQYGEKIKNLTYVVEKPFVVVGNEKPSIVRRRAEKTVRWAVSLLKKDFFPKDPDHIITIWLLGDKTSYEAVSKIVTHSPPDTPFGFFNSSQRCMVMNISTGGGTLVHEIVHALLAPNFPECPSWFNEGLGSLYEQCSKKDGRIVGHTNWRLAGLQKAIKAGTVPSFKKLTGTTMRRFYMGGSGVHYAQARYLCYYLQEKGLLRTFYRQFHANFEQDPTGYKTLVKILHVRDMEKFKKKWKKYCMKLRFPG